MGGHGSGGHPGVGRKPFESVDESEPLAVLEAPAELAADQRAIWDELAPLAAEKRTLTSATARRFRLLCKAIAMEASMSDKIAEDGWTYIAVTIDGAGNQRETLKAHPLCGAQRGMMQRIEAGLVAFRLAPTGRALSSSPKEKPQSAFERLSATRRGLRAAI